MAKAAGLGDSSKVCVAGVRNGEHSLVGSGHGMGTSGAHWLHAMDFGPLNWLGHVQDSWNLGVHPD
eukprot:12344331-Alexandrium_andersonii.AAC.1